MAAPQITQAQLELCANLYCQVDCPSVYLCIHGTPKRQKAALAYLVQRYPDLTASSLKPCSGRRVRPSGGSFRASLLRVSGRLFSGTFWYARSEWRLWTSGIGPFRLRVGPVYREDRHASRNKLVARWSSHISDPHTPRPT